jgi:hypothetical protein
VASRSSSSSDVDQRPGLRGHVLVVAAVALAATVIAAVWLGGKERRSAATNSIAPAEWVTRVAAGERLCVGRLWMPADSNAVRLQLAGRGRASPRVALRLETPEGARTFTAPAARAGGGVDFAVRPITRDAQVRLCLKPDSGLRVAGMRDRKVAGAGYDWRTFQADGRTPVELDGKPLPARVSVSFLEPSARSLASTLPDVIRRAALFRPGFVGGFTYLVMFALLAVLWFLGLRLLWGERS